MDDKSRRKLDTFTRVAAFGAEHASDFATNSIGKQLFTELSSIVATLGGHASSQTSGQGSARQGTSSRSAAREELRSDLEAISRTARALADTIPGIEDKFRIPRTNLSDQHLLAVGRAFATNAVPFSEQFIALELRADFLQDLNDDIALLETAISEQASGKGDYIAARAEIERSVEAGVSAVRKLDAIMKNKYPNNSGVLAEWLSASHTERSPRRKRTPQQTHPTSGSSTPPNPS